MVATMALPIAIDLEITFMHSAKHRMWYGGVSGKSLVHILILKLYCVRARIFLSFFVSSFSAYLFVCSFVCLCGYLFLFFVTHSLTHSVSGSVYFAGAAF